MLNMAFLPEIPPEQTSNQSLQKLSSSHCYLYLLLAALMLATRTHHFSSLNALPSASIAIFFLAGMYLRSLSSFWFFYLLSIAIDLGASYARGQLSACLTPSYPMLVFSYAAMWATGYYLHPKWTTFASSIFSVTFIVPGLVIVSSLAFFISNGSYYALSGKFPTLTLIEYSTRVEKYYLGYITNPFCYVAIGLCFDYCLVKFFKGASAKAAH